ncbi:hypothetical protein HDU98_008521 [Podochytrium sp. JEL0797]|nr:hypothetical protein HDU98_008521 [Podochytrium sp. JEL0797]
MPSTQPGQSAALIIEVAEGLTFHDPESLTMYHPDKKPEQLQVVIDEEDAAKEAAEDAAKGAAVFGGASAVAGGGTAVGLGVHAHVATGAAVAAKAAVAPLLAAKTLALYNFAVAAGGAVVTFMTPAVGVVGGAVAVGNVAAAGAGAAAASHAAAVGVATAATTATTAVGAAAVFHVSLVAAPVVAVAGGLYGAWRGAAWLFGKPETSPLLKTLMINDGEVEYQALVAVEVTKGSKPNRVGVRAGDDLTPLVMKDSFVKATLSDPVTAKSLTVEVQSYDAEKSEFFVRFY